MVEITKVGKMQVKVAVLCCRRRVRTLRTHARCAVVTNGKPWRGASRHTANEKKKTTKVQEKKKSLKMRRITTRPRMFCLHHTSPPHILSACISGIPNHLECCLAKARQPTQCRHACTHAHDVDLIRSVESSRQGKQEREGRKGKETIELVTCAEMKL